MGISDNMKINNIPPILAVVGLALVTFKYPFYGFSIWSISNPMLMYINRKDRGQVYMYAIYEIFTIFGLINYIGELNL